MIWFDLDYQDTKLGPADVNIWFSVKGEDKTATLKINSQEINFTDVFSYTEGKIYSGATLAVNTTQLVTYEILDNTGKRYTGNMILPDEVTGNFPDFNPNNNFAPSWVYGGDSLNPPKSPDFQLVYAWAMAEDTSDTRVYMRQLDGIQRNYTLLSTFWQPLTPLGEFFFSVWPITYKMVNGNKVLTVGTSYDAYCWCPEPPELVQPPRVKFSDIMELIHQDQQK